MLERNIGDVSRYNARFTRHSDYSGHIRTSTVDAAASGVMVGFQGRIDSVYPIIKGAELTPLASHLGIAAEKNGRNEMILVALRGQKKQRRKWEERTLKKKERE